MVRLPADAKLPLTLFDLEANGEEYESHEALIDPAMQLQDMAANPGASRKGPEAQPKRCGLVSSWPIPRKYLLLL